MTLPPHPATLPLDDLARECRITRTRRSGPGGQHRNKVETAIVAHHLPTGIRVEASERRSQAENRGVALFRLRVRLAIEVRRAEATRDEDRRKIVPPSTLWKSRCRGGRIEVSPTHDDFPAMLAEALDAVFVCSYEIPPAADHLGVTTSQLLRLIRREPAALVRVNAARRERRLRALK